jgi:superfamily II DNA or RNA helicase
METIRVRKLTHANLHVECNSGIAAELREYFSFYVPGYKFMPAFKNRMWDGKIRLFDSNSGELPAGLFFHLQEFCKQRAYMLGTETTRYGGPIDTVHINPKLIMEWIEGLGLPFKIRDYQFDALCHALHHKRNILVSPTGSGKSLIIYLLAKFWLQMLSDGVAYPKAGRVLIIVPTTSLVEQMHNDLIEYGQGPKGVHRIYSGKDKKFDAAICISTWQSIYKLPKAWFDQFGMVIGDECHGFKSKSLMNIMNKATEAGFRYGTTGTLDGTQTHELVLQGLFGKIHRVTTTRNLQDEKTLADLNIDRLEIKYKDTSDFGKRTYQEEIDWIVKHDLRNRFIRNLALASVGNTLVLYNLVENHGKPLFNLIKDKAAEDRKIFFVSGQTHTEDREAIRKIVEKQHGAIIVASLGTFSTGINIRNLHNIVFASPSKSQIRVLQSIGRGLRQSEDGSITKLYDIIDNITGKNFAYSHGEERLKIYQKEKFKYKTHTVDL